VATRVLVSLAICQQIGGSQIESQWSGALTNAGFALADDKGADAAFVSIVIFNSVSDELRKVIATCSHAGRKLLIAVSVGDEPDLPSEVWGLLSAGAQDILRCEDVNTCAANISQKVLRWASVEATLNSPLVQKNLVGQSNVWRRFLSSVIEVAQFTSSSVLLLGESGTGKELVARLIHTLDARKEKGQLVILDCTTISSELSGSEFFGHERGSYTGATNQRDGAFALAHRGTLFLDEVGELPLPMQAQLLRVIQEHTYKRVGSNTWQSTDFRLICATNRNLEAEVQQGRFRADLYYRIATCVFHLPPLRDRPEDTLSIASHLLKNATESRDSYQFDDVVASFLVSKSYPGNVRELTHLVSRIAQRHVGSGPITVGDIPFELRPEKVSECSSAPWGKDELDDAVRRALILGAGLRDVGHAATEAAIRIAIQEANGNLQQAAKRLGVTDRALQLRRTKERVGASSYGRE
jgi:transcriptional regulator with GAF, ATPase, and Fis domain